MKPIFFDTSIFNFTGTPDFVSLGFQRSVLVTGWGFYRKLGGVPDTDHIDLEVCKRAATDEAFWKEQRGMPIVLDEEALELHSPDVPKRDDNHDQLIDAVKLFREYHPGQAIGIYARMPERQLDAAIAPKDSPQYKAWQARNRHFFENLDDKSVQVVNRGLADQVDRVYPSLYFWNELPANMSQFKLYADRNLEEAAIYRKPIIAYVTPQQQRGELPLYPREAWREMVRYVYGHPLVDGISVFVLPTGDKKWDEQAEWWLEVKALRSEQ